MIMASKNEVQPFGLLGQSDVIRPPHVSESNNQLSAVLSQLLTKAVSNNNIVDVIYVRFVHSTQSVQPLFLNKSHEADLEPVPFDDAAFNAMAQSMGSEFIVDIAEKPREISLSRQFLEHVNTKIKLMVSWKWEKNIM